MQPHGGQSGLPVHASPLEYVEASRTKPVSAGKSSHILDHVPAVECTVRRSRTTAHARKLQEQRLPPPPSALPTPPRRSQPRTCDRAKRDNRTGQKGPVGIDRVSAPVREGRPAHRTRESFESRSGLSSRRLPKSYWRDPLRHLPGHVAQYGPVVLELFSGSGRWAAAWRSTTSARRFDCFELDIRWHLKNDLLSPSVQRRIRGWIRSGLICAVWMGTPCNSFSRARDRPGGPPPLRSDDHPHGLPNLAPHDQEKVRVGNILARFSISIFQCCVYLQVPATIENPETSRLWKLESSQRARLTSRTTWTATDSS